MDVIGGITDAGKTVATAATDAGKTVATTATNVAGTVTDAGKTAANAAGNIATIAGEAQDAVNTIQHLYDLWEKYQYVVYVIIALLAFSVVWSLFSMCTQWCKCCYKCAICWGKCSYHIFECCECLWVWTYHEGRRTYDKHHVNHDGHEGKHARAKRLQNLLAKVDNTELHEQIKRDFNRLDYKCLPTSVKDEIFDHQHVNYRHLKEGANKEMHTCYDGTYCVGRECGKVPVPRTQEELKKIKWYGRADSLVGGTINRLRQKHRDSRATQDGRPEDTEKGGGSGGGGGGGVVE